jgi:hypothetical protein
MPVSQAVNSQGIGSLGLRNERVHCLGGSAETRQLQIGASPTEKQDMSKFDWDNANIGHISEHDVTPEEAEEVLLGDSLDVGFDVVNGEERWPYLGETNEGRVLWVVITFRGERMRVVTAFEPDKQWKLFYFEQRAGLQ